MYFPQAHVGAYDGGAKAAKAAYTAEAYGRYARPKANAPGSLASLDAMVRDAEHAWGAGQPLGGSPSSPYFVRVWHPGDANSYVELRRSYARDMTMNMDQLYFDAGSGALLHRFEAAPVMTAQRLISGLHFIQFEHWTLRWLYFLAGLSGCVLIATGFLFWLEARRAQHAKKGLAGVRLVEGLTIGSVTGIIIATLAFLIANRLLPLHAALAGVDRAGLEVWAFYLTWIATFAHAWLRFGSGPGLGRAWREQASLIAALSVLAVLLNWLTTGDHLLQTMSTGRWAVAGVDLMLLVVAMLALAAARRLGRVPGRLSIPGERQRA